MSVKKSCRAVLCDIEGTTTSIKFVKFILFPYSQVAMFNFLKENDGNDEVQSVVSSLLREINENNFNESKDIPKKDSDTQKYYHSLANFINNLIEKDYKISSLKTLQGLIWRKGYENHELSGHVYPDVPDTFKDWKNKGIKIYIYSSGSVEAQKLLFSKTQFGDLVPYIDGYFDTKIGPKREQESYKMITKEIGCNALDILFITDIPEEAYAALNAGMRAIIMDRPENNPLSELDKLQFSVLKSFNMLELSLCE